LLLARAVARRTQTAVRLALGATRGQIVAEALTESVLLALAGGLAGLLVAVGAARLLLALAFRTSDFVPIISTPSPVVLAFAVALALGTAVVFGVAPAWLGTRVDPVDALRGSGRGACHHAVGPGTPLLAVQATLCVVLVAVATMLARSLDNLQHQDVGFSVEGRVIVGLNRLPATYTPLQLSVLYQDIDQRLARLPGVRGHGLSLYNPLGPSNWGEIVVVAGHSPNAGNRSEASWDRVSAEYLHNLGVTVVRGRSFTAGDDDTTSPVAVVNEAFVKRFFTDNEDPLDQHFGVERPDYAATFRIVGIVRDAKFAASGLHQPPRPMFFAPLTQWVQYDTDHQRMIERLSHLVRGIILVTDRPVGDLEPVLRRELADADPNLTIINVRTLQQQLDVSLDRERSVVRLAELFGLAALVLAAAGMYAVTAYMVARQTKEIGIRMALGADRASVIRLVLSQAFQRLAIGLGMGLALAVGAARFLAAQLYGVSFWDPFALAVAAGSLTACVLAAALVPAARAAAMSPMGALRID
jgi:predicted permease